MMIPVVRPTSVATRRVGGIVLSVERTLICWGSVTPDYSAALVDYVTAAAICVNRILRSASADIIVGGISVFSHWRL